MRPSYNVRLISRGGLYSRSRTNGVMMMSLHWRTNMSQYVFHCRDCNKEFTRTLHIADHEKGEVVCPHYCGKNVEQLVTAFSAVTSKKS
jgi:putative FmdB family regulatory protein